MTVYYTHRSSSEMLPSAVEGNKERDPQLDKVQRVGDLGTLRLKWGASIKSFSSGLMEPGIRRNRKSHLFGRYKGNEVY